MSVRNGNDWNDKCHDGCDDFHHNASFGGWNWKKDRCNNDDHDVCDYDRHDAWSAKWQGGRDDDKWNGGKQHNVDCRDRCDDGHNAGWDWDKKDDSHKNSWDNSGKYGNDWYKAGDRHDDCDVDYTHCDDDSHHDVHWGWDDHRDNKKTGWKDNNKDDKDDRCDDDKHDYDKDDHNNDEHVDVVVHEVKVLTVVQQIPVITPVITEVVRPTAVLSAGPQQQPQTQAVSPVSSRTGGSSTVTPPRTGDAGLLSLNEDSSANTTTPGAAMLVAALLSVVGIAGARKVRNR
jgi:hypothetical protein